MNAKSICVALVLAFGAAACVSTGPTAIEPASDEDAAQANVNLGIGYLSQGRPDAALDALTRALDLNSRSVDAHSAIALAYDQLNDTAQAEVHHRRATQLDPNNGFAQNSYAVFLCRQDRWTDAQRYFDRAIQNPRYDSPNTARINAGTCALSDGDLASAEGYFRAALNEEPANAGALAGMIEISVQSDNFLQGRAFAQRLFAVSTPNARQLLLCYVIESSLNDASAADRCAQQLRSDYPASQEVAQLRQLERNGNGG